MINLTFFKNALIACLAIFWASNAFGQVSSVTWNVDNGQGCISAIVTLSSDGTFSVETTDDSEIIDLWDGGSPEAFDNCHYWNGPACTGILTGSIPTGSCHNYWLGVQSSTPFGHDCGDQIVPLTDRLIQEGWATNCCLEFCWDQVNYYPLPNGMDHWDYTISPVDPNVDPNITIDYVVLYENVNGGTTEALEFTGTLQGDTPYIEGAWNEYPDGSGYLRPTRVCLTVNYPDGQSDFQCIDADDPSAQCGTGSFPSCSYMPRLASTTNVEEAVDNSFQATIFPNPVKDEFNIQLKGEINSTVDIQVYDVLGKAVYSGQSSPGDLMINIQSKDFDAGVYFVNLSYDGKLVSKKFVKE